MKIYLDDIRDVPEGWTGARNFREFKILIEQTKEKKESIDGIDFDNDLGQNQDGKLELEGREILRWLAETYPEYVVTGNVELKVHSSNPVANETMKEYINFCRAHKQELLEAQNRPNPFGEMQKIK